MGCVSLQSSGLHSHRMGEHFNLRAVLLDIQVRRRKAAPEGAIIDRQAGGGRELCSSYLVEQAGRKAASLQLSQHVRHVLMWALCCVWSWCYRALRSARARSWRAPSRSRRASSTSSPTTRCVITTTTTASGRSAREGVEAVVCWQWR